MQEFFEKFCGRYDAGLGAGDKTCLKCRCNQGNRMLAADSQIMQIYLCA